MVRESASIREINYEVIFCSEVSLDGDFSPVERRLVHRHDGLLCRFALIILYHALASAQAALIQANARVHHFAKLCEGSFKLIFVDREG